MRSPEEIEHTMQAYKSLPADFDGLVEKLSDPDLEVRGAAARRLREMDDDRAVEPLLRALDDESGRVRYAAALGLGYYKTSDAVSSLISHLKDDPSRDVRAICASSLGFIGGDEAMDAITDALEDSDGQVRRSAARIFADEQDKRAVSKLLEMLGDPDWHVRYVVCETLVILGVGDERISETTLALGAMPEARELAELNTYLDATISAYDAHPAVTDLLDEFRASHPDASPREAIGMLRDRLGSDVIPELPDDPLVALAERAKMLVSRGEQPQ
jgi:HEAT repeat protein